MHSSMSMKLPRVDASGKEILDRWGKGVFNVRSIQPDEPVVFTASLVERLLEHGRGRNARAKDFDDKKMPELSVTEMAEESIN